MRMRGVIMKERIEKIKEWIRKNKKRTIGIAAAAVLLVGALGIGIAGVNGFGSNAAQPDKTVVSVKGTSEDKENTDIEEEDTKQAEDKKETEEKQKTKAQKELAEKKEEAEKSASSNTEQTSTKSSESSNSSTSSSNAKSASSNTSGSSTSSSNSSSSSSSNSSKPTHTHNYNIPVYSSKQVYVVDQAAWTETVEEPIYSTKEVAICNTCGADISGYAGEHLDETMHDGYHSEVQTVQTGTDTYTINHPEEGHYETESYISGYKCSCGASK